MKSLSLSILISSCICLLQYPNFIDSHSNLNGDLLTTLQKKAAYTDKSVVLHSNDLIVLVKVPGKNALLRVKGDQWPDEIEYTFNILKNSSGKIVFIAQLFESESGDWEITNKHYFDDQGSVYAFSNSVFVANDNDKGGSAQLLLIRYYDTKSKMINETNKLMDGHGKVLKGNKRQYDFPDDDYTIYKNLKDCLAGYNIKL